MADNKYKLVIDNVSSNMDKLKDFILSEKFLKIVGVLIVTIFLSMLYVNYTNSNKQQIKQAVNRCGYNNLIYQETDDSITKFQKVEDGKVYNIPTEEDLNLINKIKTELSELSEMSNNKYASFI